MEDFLIILLQFLFEFLFEVLLYWPIDLPFLNRETPDPERLYFRGFLWWCAGCALAFVSLIIFQHTFIAFPALRIINLISAPIVSARLAKHLAAARAKSNPNIIPRNHFWQAFWFTLGFAAVRFAYASRI